MKKLFLILTCLILACPVATNADEKLVDLVKKIKPSVSLVETFDKDNKPLLQGSGFFVDNNRHLVTNLHVIKGACSAKIKTVVGKEYSVDGIAARDIEADIVKLAVNITASQKKDIFDEIVPEPSTAKQIDANFPFLKLSSQIPSEGEDIIVVGNPLGLESSLSTGVVSAVRDIPAFGKILQITAPVSPGSSGSPVVNMRGEVLGVATLVLKEGQNLNFAVPSYKILELKESPSPITLATYAATTRRCEVTDKSCTDPYVWCESGFCYWEYDFYNEAVEAFKQAIYIDPNFGYSELGLCYARLGRYDEAIGAYKQAICIKPDDASSYSEIGDIYEKINRHKEAIEAYNQAIDTYKRKINIKSDESFDTAWSYNGLGDIYLKLGRYDEAVEAYRQTIRLCPIVLAHYNLGVAYVKLARYAEAAEAFKQTIKISPDFAGAHYDLGTTYLKLDDTSSALKEYKILKDLDAEKANQLFNLIYR